MKKKTKLFGILNVTPDSCYDGGKFFSLEKAVLQAIHMEAEGADYIDVGGESTRPGSKEVSLEEELRRVIPVISELSKTIKIPISIDTKKATVAAKALEAGASFINDISGLQDVEMQKLVAASGVSVCVMHMQGTPDSMQQNPSYPKGVVVEICSWFRKKVEELELAKINSSQIIFDPGIGFGKTVAQNFEILENLQELKKMGFPLFLGISRKFFMMQTLGKLREELLPATLAMASYAILNEVDYLRVHDVGSHRDAINILGGLKK